MSSLYIPQIDCNIIILEMLPVNNGNIAKCITLINNSAYTVNVTDINYIKSCISVGLFDKAKNRVLSIIQQQFKSYQINSGECLGYCLWQAIGLLIGGVRMAIFSDLYNLHVLGCYSLAALILWWTVK